VALSASDYRVDKDNGLLYRLCGGYASLWAFYRDIVIVYVAGYIMPEETSSNLPGALQAGCIDLVKSFWMSRRRDPMVKSVDVPGVIAEQFWVGSVGEEGDLPPSVQEKVMPFRRATV
jgi:hypothetical protein